MSVINNISVIKYIDLDFWLILNKIRLNSIIVRQPLNHKFKIKQSEEN